VRRIELTSKLTDEAATALAGTFMSAKDFDVLVSGEDATVLKPDGSPLLIYRNDILPFDACKAAYSSLRQVSLDTSRGNRGLAAGKLDPKIKGWDGTAAIVSGTRWRILKKDGTVSNTDLSKPVQSGIAGYFDRYERFPYCRLTAFNLNRPQMFAAALPFIRAVDRAFAVTVPERYAAQRSIVEKTHPDFFISGTAFTTITVNRNWQTAVHQDAGDYRPGFGVMSVLEAGDYKGGYLVFPQYRVAVDMRSRGVCMADVHEWHGNTPLVGKPGQFERISCVFYYRQDMHRCGSAAEELERAKNKKPGQGRWD
jgi:hypothetical protein